MKPDITFLQEAAPKVSAYAETLLKNSIRFWYWITWKYEIQK